MIVNNVISTYRRWCRDGVVLNAHGGLVRRRWCTDHLNLCYLCFLFCSVVVLGFFETMVVGRRHQTKILGIFFLLPLLQLFQILFHHFNLFFKRLILVVVQTVADVWYYRSHCVLIDRMRPMNAMAMFGFVS